MRELVVGETTGVCKSSQLPRGGKLFRAGDRLTLPAFDYKAVGNKVCSVCEQLRP